MYLLIITFMAFLLGAVLLNNLLDCELNSDDAGGPFYVWTILTGKTNFSLLNIGITQLAVYLSYYFFGISLKTCYVSIILVVVIILYLTLVLSAVHVQCCYYWLGVFSVWFFVFLPHSNMGPWALKYHNNILFCTMAVLTCIDVLYNRQVHSKKLYVLLAVILVYSYIPMDALIYVECIVPMIVVIFIKYKELKNEGQCFKREKALFVICIISSTLGITINRILTGGNSGGVYTGEGIMFAADSDHILSNLKSYIDGLIMMFDVEFYNTKVLSGSTLYFFVKIILLFAAVYIMYQELKNVMMGRKYDVVIVFIAISFICVSMAYIFGDVVKSVGGRRYLNSFVYTFPIVLSRKLCRLDLNWTKIRSLKYGAFTSILVLAVIKIHLFPIMDFTIRTQEQDILQEFLVDHNLEYGYAEFWTAGRTSLAAGLDVKLVPASAGIKTGESGWEPYCLWLEDEQAFFNYIVINKGEHMPVKYGVPIKKYDVSKYYIYVYDYDIRLVSDYL